MHPVPPADVVRRRVAAALLSAALGVTAACSDTSPEEARAQFADQQQAVTDVVLELRDSLDRSGLAVEHADGRVDSCTSSEERGVRFDASGRIAGDGSLADRVDRARGALEDAGWEVVDAGEGSDPWVKLDRDGVELFLGRTERRAADEAGFDVTSPECIASSEGSAIADRPVEHFSIVD